MYTTKIELIPHVPEIVTYNGTSTPPTLLTDSRGRLRIDGIRGVTREVNRFFAWACNLLYNVTTGRARTVVWSAGEVMPDPAPGEVLIRTYQLSAYQMEAITRKHHKGLTMQEIRQDIEKVVYALVDSMRQESERGNAEAGDHGQDDDGASGGAAVTGIEIRTPYGEILCTMTGCAGMTYDEILDLAGFRTINDMSDPDWDDELPVIAPNGHRYGYEELRAVNVGPDYDDPNKGLTVEPVHYETTGGDMGPESMPVDYLNVIIRDDQGENPLELKAWVEWDPDLDEVENTYRNYPALYKEIRRLAQENEIPLERLYFPYGDGDVESEYPSPDVNGSAQWATGWMAEGRELLQQRERKSLIKCGEIPEHM